MSGKINEATHVLVIVGKEDNKLHRDRLLIGCRNWQNFEVAKAKELKNCGAKRVYSFNHDDIVQAIRGW